MLQFDALNDADHDLAIHRIILPIGQFLKSFSQGFSLYEIEVHKSSKDHLVDGQVDACKALNCRYVLLNKIKGSLNIYHGLHMAASWYQKRGRKFVIPIISFVGAGVAKAGRRAKAVPPPIVDHLNQSAIPCFVGFWRILAAAFGRFGNAFLNDLMHARARVTAALLSRGSDALNR